MNFKRQIHQKFTEIVQDRIDVFRDMISGLSEDSKNDAKGSAGDKHETALSMMHIEQEKLNQKLQECLEQKAVLDKIAANANASQTIVLGSLVIANGIRLYVSVALPKISVDNISIIALSPRSPLGSKLMGKAVGYSFEVNSSQYRIENVV